MAKIRNVSGDDLVVPGLGGRLVPKGAVVDVDDAVVESYTVCVALWARADKVSPSGADSTPADDSAK